MKQRQWEVSLSQLPARGNTEVVYGKRTSPAKLARTGLGFGARGSHGKRTHQDGRFEHPNGKVFVAVVERRAIAKFKQGLSDRGIYNH